jgi:flagellar basal body-associated protein FliL
MAEERENGEEKKPVEKPKAKPGPNVIVIVAAILAFNALVAFLTITVFIPKEKDDFEKILKHDEDTVEVEEVVSINLEGEVVLATKIDLVVNIAGTNGERFLKIKLSLAYDSKASGNSKNIEADLTIFETQLKSKVNEYLSSLTFNQVNDRNAIANIRTALLPELNAMVPNKIGKLSNVYVEEFIIQ